MRFRTDKELDLSSFQTYLNRKLIITLVNANFHKKAEDLEKTPKERTPKERTPKERTTDEGNLDQSNVVGTV